MCPRPKFSTFSKNKKGYLQLTNLLKKLDLVAVHSPSLTQTKLKLFIEPKKSYYTFCKTGFCQSIRDKCNCSASHTIYNIYMNTLHHLLFLCSKVQWEQIVLYTPECVLIYFNEMLVVKTGCLKHKLCTVKSIYRNFQN